MWSVGYMLLHVKDYIEKKEKRDRVLPKVYAIFRVKTKKSLRFPRTWLVFFFFRVKVLPVFGVFFGLESTYYRWLGVDAYVHVYTLLKVFFLKKLYIYMWKITLLTFLKSQKRYVEKK